MSSRRAPNAAAHGRAATHRLAPRRDVGEHPVPLLGAAERQAESGDHLVEDQQDLVLVADLPHPLEEAGLGRDHAAAREHGLADDGGELVAMVAHEALGPVKVVERPGDDQLLLEARDAGMKARRLRRPLGTGRLERERVAVEEPVVAGLPLEDLLLARERAREAYRGLGGLGPGIGEAHLLDPGHGLHDLAPDFVVEFVGEGVHHAAFRDLAGDGFDDGAGAVAEDHRSIAQAPVDVGVTVRVGEPRSISRLPSR